MREDFLVREFGCSRITISMLKYGDRREVFSCFSPHESKIAGNVPPVPKFLPPARFSKLLGVVESAVALRAAGSTCFTVGTPVILARLRV
jgi:hypothetical protein